MEHGQPQDAALSAIDPYGELAARAARSDCTILITGETGVGKGHLAKWLHQQSRRQDGPFVPVNCGAIPETLIDSQLFGHMRGAFSGATADHMGLIRAAEHGTLFLDEVGELPNSAQIRLLRLLQDREVQPVGRSRPVIVNLRIMAAANNDLAEAVQERRFREDLRFRLDVVRIHMKPLRERLEELPGLLTIFDLEFTELYTQPRLRFSDEALANLQRYDWPGNIRELRTVVERLHVLCPGELIDARLLRQAGQLDTCPDDAEPLPRSLDMVRHEEVLRVLKDTGGSVIRTAAVFGVHRSTVYRWLSGRARSPAEHDAR